jgi:hypothetical protein
MTVTGCCWLVPGVRNGIRRVCRSSDFLASLIRWDLLRDNERGWPGVTAEGRPFFGEVGRLAPAVSANWGVAFRVASHPRHGAFSRYSADRSVWPAHNRKWHSLCVPLGMFTALPADETAGLMTGGVRRPHRRRRVALAIGTRCECQLVARACARRCRRTWRRWQRGPPDPESADRPGRPNDTRSECQLPAPRPRHPPPAAAPFEPIQRHRRGKSPCQGRSII